MTPDYKSEIKILKFQKFANLFESRFLFQTVLARITPQNQYKMNGHILEKD